MNVCPVCGAHLLDGMTCRDYFNQVMGEEYMVMSPRNDFLAAHKLTGVSYILQHPHEHSDKQLAFALRLLELVFREGYFPLKAAEVLQRQFAYRLPAFDVDYLPRAAAYPLNIGNFRRRDEPYLESAYRWGRSVLETIDCNRLNSLTLQTEKIGA